MGLKYLNPGETVRMGKSEARKVVAVACLMELSHKVGPCTICTTICNGASGIYCPNAGSVGNSQNFILISIFVIQGVIMKIQLNTLFSIPFLSVSITA